MRFWRPRIRDVMAVLVAVAGLTSFYPGGRAETKTAGKTKVQGKSQPAKKGAANRSTPRRQVAGKTGGASARSRRRVPHRRRLAQLRLEPARIQEIQLALTKAGYLNQEPTGRWDEQTRAAMLRYQADHGFPTTGLPEAKTLMKLGLGPHPLPEDVDPSAAARASAEARAKTEPSADQTPQPDPPASGSPHDR